ncbi:hypothetical protein MTo_04492 [Microcystis aeruginosa NIES-1211]|nr:hypothetical protein MTo_04492 [Microcystis aeruginosa NIES-1211]
MTLTFDKLTPELITNLYLYGQIETPTNLVDDKLIRPKQISYLPISRTLAN